MVQDTLMADTLFDDTLSKNSMLPSGTSIRADAIMEELEAQRYFEELLTDFEASYEDVESDDCDTSSGLNLTSKVKIVETDTDEEDDDIYYDGDDINADVMDEKDDADGNNHGNMLKEAIDYENPMDKILCPIPSTDQLDLGGVEDYENSSINPLDGNDRPMSSPPSPVLSPIAGGTIIGLPTTEPTTWDARAKPNAPLLLPRDRTMNHEITLTKNSSFSSKNSSTSTSSSAVSELRANLEMVWNGEMFGEARLDENLKKQHQQERLPAVGSVDDDDVIGMEEHEADVDYDDINDDDVDDFDENAISTSDSDVMSIASGDAVVPIYGAHNQLESILGGGTHMDDDDVEPDLLPPTAIEISFNSIWNENPKDDFDVSSTDRVIESPYYYNAGKYNTGHKDDTYDTESPTESRSTEGILTMPEYSDKKVDKNSSSVKVRGGRRSTGAMSLANDSSSRDRVMDAMNNIKRSVAKNIDALGGVTKIVLVRNATTTTEEPSVQVSSDGGGSEDEDVIVMVLKGDDNHSHTPRRKEPRALAGTKRAIARKSTTNGRVTNAASVRSTSLKISKADEKREESHVGDEEAPCEVVDTEDTVDGGGEPSTSSDMQGKELDVENARRCLWIIILLSFSAVVLLVISVVIYIYVLA